MCEDCGCSVTESSADIALDVIQKLNAENDRQAAHNRAHFNKHSVLCINLMSSPGSGKTALLERFIRSVGQDFRIGVIEGDLETENDANRIRKTGALAFQINTSTACHLEAAQIHRACHDLPLDQLDILFIENVGNLVCPAGFDLGQHFNVVLLASTEGDDKPSKYPVMFRQADLVLFSKADLRAVLDDFSVLRAMENIRNLAVNPPCFEISSKTGNGMDVFIQWVSEAYSQIPTSAVALP